MDDFDTLPLAAQPYFTAAIAPGTALARTVRLVMRGEIKMRDRWLGFRAEQVLTPQVGFVWAARVAGVVTGSDQYVSGRGWMSWKVAGLFSVVDAHGPDVSRSGRGAMRRGDLLVAVDVAAHVSGRRGPNRRRIS